MLTLVLHPCMYAPEYSALLHLITVPYLHLPHYYYFLLFRVPLQVAPLVSRFLLKVSPRLVLIPLLLGYLLLLFLLSKSLLVRLSQLMSALLQVPLLRLAVTPLLKSLLLVLFLLQVHLQLLVIPLLLMSLLRFA